MCWTALLLAAVLALGGCGEDPAPASGPGHNAADVAFATDMIQHHAQALMMVDTTMGREPGPALSPATADLMEEIRLAQAPEIEQMAALLTSWDEPVPETSRDHANAHGDGGDALHDADMPGMMSAEEMAALESASDQEYERLLLDMMIEHHEGAVEMARTELDEGENAEARRLAEQIIGAQESEIERMERMLG